MRCGLTFAVVTLCSAVFPLLSWGGGPISIPGPGQGYQITKNDTSQPAPEGYEGRTDMSTETAVGNTPATAGKRIVANFTLGNQIKTCPLADGTAEGTGVFSVSVDYTDAQPNGTSKTHIETRAHAKYKGQVGDDALLHGQVNAEIDYTYKQTGTFRDKNGAMTTTPPINIPQYISIPFTVAGNMTAPTLGAFSGGDPTKGHYSEAFGLGTALTYWAGIYYAIAQIKWYGGEVSGGGTSVRGGQCVHVAFDPPSYTLQPPLGMQAKVGAQIKTKTGESVKANFVGIRPFNGSGVTPGGGLSNAGQPLRLTYIAPSKPTKPAGFSAIAVSRAGVAEGDWLTGLGTGWSGEITYFSNEQKQQSGGDMGGYSTSEAMQFTVTVKDDVGTATSHAEATSNSISKQYAADAKGGKTLITIASENSSASADGTSPAQVHVNINQSNGTYSIDLSWKPATGKSHLVSCQRDKCEASDPPYYANAAYYPGIYGEPLSDPNHLSGSKANQTPLGSGPEQGQRTWTVTWNLARSGSK